MISRAIQNPRRARVVLLAAALAALTLLPACRCGGGFGRRYSAKSMDWTFEQIGLRACADKAAFADHVANIPDFLTPDFDGSARELSRTFNLYTSGVAEPCWCPEGP